MRELGRFKMDRQTEAEALRTGQLILVDLPSRSVRPRGGGVYQPRGTSESARYEFAYSFPDRGDGAQAVGHQAFGSNYPLSIICRIPGRPQEIVGWYALGFRIRR